MTWMAQGQLRRGVSVGTAAPIIVNAHISYENAALWTVIYMLIKTGSESEEARPSKSFGTPAAVPMLGLDAC